MMPKVFLDTNIILDFLDQNRSRHSISSAIVKQCLMGDIIGCISESVITNCTYILRKSYDQKQLSEIFSNFSDFFQILGLTGAWLKIACRLNIHDLEDSILYRIALENECQFFITSNLADFVEIAQPTLPVISPESFVELNVTFQ